MHRLTWLVYFCTLTGICSQNWNTTIFSAPPSGLPVRRVYIHNRPVYVRQLFMIPQRIDLEKTHGNTDALLTNDETLTLRSKRSGFPPIVPFAAPAANAGAAPAASAAAASSASAAAASSANAAAASYYSYAPAAPQTFYQPSVPSSFPAQPAKVILPISPAIAAPAVVPPQPVPLIQPLPIQPSPQPIGELPVAEPEVTRPNYPLPSCYTNNCNNEVEDGMVRSFNELKESRADWSSCNLQQISNRVQQNLEREYNTSFEVIVGVGDYASRNLICKVELDGKFILSYATAHADAEDYPEGGANVGQNGDDSGSYRENNNANAYPSSPPNDDAYGNEASAKNEGSYKKFNFSFRI
ncbi:Ground-like domain-containing protein [Aphelenchoides besseyi]|nr:Ground-like domain-containing protein [Aphelenchoides besseyi]